MNKQQIYEAKQLWLEKVMASSLTPAQKVFAFSIYKRAFGIKTTSYPATEHLQEDTGLARSKFSDYRKALFACGALTGVKDRQARGRQENYTYTLNLDWDGQVPCGDSQVPCGDSQVPSGGTNTTSNTTTKTTRKTTTVGYADGTEVTPLPNPEQVPVLSNHEQCLTISDTTKPQVPSGDLKEVQLARARAYNASKRCEETTHQSIMEEW